MDRVEQAFGKTNPNAPAALSGFAFVIGRWRCDASVNLRTYDAARQSWNIRWLNALAGTWVDLGPEELGGVTFDGQSIIYAFREPMADHAYTRATSTNISENHFTWRGEGSDDRKTWSEFMVVEVYRREEWRSSRNALAPLLVAEAT